MGDRQYAENRNRKKRIENREGGRARTNWQDVSSATSPETKKLEIYVVSMSDNVD